MTNPLDLIDTLNIKSTRLRFALHYLLKSQDGTETEADLDKAVDWIRREKLRAAETVRLEAKAKKPAEEGMWHQRAITQDTKLPIQQEGAD